MYGTDEKLRALNPKKMLILCLFTLILRLGKLRHIDKCYVNGKSKRNAWRHVFPGVHMHKANSS